MKRETQEALQGLIGMYKNSKELLIINVAISNPNYFGTCKRHKGERKDKKRVWCMTIFGVLSVL